MSLCCTNDLEWMKISLFTKPIYILITKEMYIDKVIELQVILSLNGVPIFFFLEEKDLVWKVNLLPFNFKVVLSFRKQHNQIPNEIVSDNIFTKHLGKMLLLL